MVNITKEILWGLNESHLAPFNGKLLLHKEIHSPLLAMQNAATKAGFKLQVASGFRNYNRQLTIWNEKARGLRTLYDTNSNPIDPLALTREQLFFAILRWSAFPGTSRHHWGTDFDVFDESAMPSHYQLQLSPEECAPNGIFGPFHHWLDSQAHDFGFYRPYATDLGGVAPERWHLSYFPIAHKFFEAFTQDSLLQLLNEYEVELIDVAKMHMPALYKRFITNITLPPTL